MINIIEIETYNSQVLNGQGLKLVRFCAEWSGSCQIMAPIYKELSKIFKKSASFYNIDIEKVPLLKKQYGVEQLPTILFFQNGRVIDYVTGMISREALIEKLEKAIK